MPCETRKLLISYVSFSNLFSRYRIHTPIILVNEYELTVIRSLQKNYSIYDEWSEIVVFNENPARNKNYSKIHPNWEIYMNMKYACGSHVSTLT